MWIKRFHNDEHGLISAMLFVITGLFFIAVVVWFIFPIENFIANTMVEYGAPLTQTRFTQRMMAWSIGGIGVAMVVYGFMRVYRKTFDSGYNQGG